MSLRAPIIFAAFHFEDADFCPATMPDHRRRHRFFRRIRPEADLSAVGDHQYARQFHRLARGGGQFFDAKPVADGDFVLLAAAFDNCIHDFLPSG